jgi:hypothetical protein
VAGDKQGRAMSDNNTVGAVIEAAAGHPDLVSIGVNVGKLYTDHGFPIDMSLSELAKRGMSKQQQLAVLEGACQWLIEHRRLSGAPEKAIERQRKLNRQMVERFLKIGEVGLY